MSIRVYNTLSKTKEAFEPVVQGKVGMYLCGPTVYKPSHIGHMVGPILFDVVKRYLVYSGYDVTWVVNITDVDDKLIDAQNKRGVPMAKIAEEMTADYMACLKAVGVDGIDHFPRATAHMDGIIEFIQELIARGYAYAVSNGDVYFDVGRDAEYGKLSGRSVDQMQGDGGGSASFKRSPTDFALWKSAKPGEPAWKSPWGEGRPGWHIECSAMSRAILGKTFDIHGGGLDLAFPHHENEIAQSECCHGAPQAKYWMHNGLMQKAGETGKVGGRATAPAGAVDLAAEKAKQEAGKLAGSQGAQAFQELLKKFSGELIRFFLLSTHYRSPITFSEELIGETGTALDAFYRYFQRYERITKQSFYTLAAPATRGSEALTEAVVTRALGGAPGDKPTSDAAKFLEQVKLARTAFLAAMDDDFNTGGAMGELTKMVRLLNRYADEEHLERPENASTPQVETLKAATLALKEVTQVLGLFRTAPAAESTGGDEVLLGGLVKVLIDLRAELRKGKNFALADKVRTSLSDLGILLEDRPGGTDWSRKKAGAV